MIRQRSTVKLLILFTALATMALGASHARGELFADWYVSNEAVGNFLLPALAVKEVAGGSASLLTTSGATSVKISCTSVNLVGARLEVFGSGEISAVEFHGCATYLKEKLSKPCEPFVNLYNEKGEFVATDKGTIISTELIALIRLHEGKGVLLIEPALVENRFATINLGEECAVGEKMPITGKLYLQDSEFATSKVEHKFTEGPLTELIASSTKAASIDGSVVVVLAGAHAGLKWHGLAN